VRTPIVEPTPLFVRGLGEVTDIVEKEMYSFVDSMNGDALTLRPEGTAGVVRAMPSSTTLLYDGGKRLFYIGPMFRHERPQRAATGSSTRSASRRWACRAGCRRRGDPDGARAVARPGPADVRLELNSLGQPAERRRTAPALIAHFEPHRRPARRRRAAPPAQQPAAHPGHQEPGDAGAGRGRAAADGLPGARPR
jgi:histidyl-tRNA synthetase